VQSLPQEATQSPYLNVTAQTYRLDVSGDGLVAELSSPGGDVWLRLRPLAALDAADAPDETLEIFDARLVDERVVEVRRRSTRWDDAAVRLVCGDNSLEIRTSVRGRGRLATARLLAVRSLLPGQANGLLPSGTALTTLFSPNPDDPERIVRPAAETTTIGVVGDQEPGRQRWLFTPAPLYLCLGHIGISVVASVEQLTFPQLVFEGGDGSFALALDYEGHADVDGLFEAPALVLAPGVSDPYEGLRAHRVLLAERGVAPEPAPRDAPGWWSEPIFCGWGAQCARAVETGCPAFDFATESEYDTYLDLLEREGVVPGTIVIDDKWQATYGGNEPDPRKWPDLRRWIDDRHARGQRVLLWWKAWDVEGLPPELCVRNGDGAPLALDPSKPETKDALAAMMTRLVGPAGLDADGLKVDYTARTPSGRALSTHSGAWGISLLHELLRVVHGSVKETKPDALVITHTPHPSFAGVTDMIRLNDMLPLKDGRARDSVVAQMRHRAAVAHAACPELLVDTDDWSVPSLAAWREYLAEKPRLGVPSLYYARELDGRGEALGADDYRALREMWATWREALV
jgi:hypothetical protein